jgi:hypothetical protein
LARPPPRHVLFAEQFTVAVAVDGSDRFATNSVLVAMGAGN